VTVAFGTTPPEVSRIVPVNAPVPEVWPNTNGAKIKQRNASPKKFTLKMNLPEDLEKSFIPNPFNADFKSRLFVQAPLPTRGSFLQRRQIRIINTGKLYAKGYSLVQIRCQLL
jgi:hypothetical protein